MGKPTHRGRVFLLLAILAGLAPQIAFAATSDPLAEDQWGLVKIQAEGAWATATGFGVTIAIVDTGVDLSHRDLSPKLERGIDFVGGDSDPQDETAGPDPKDSSCRGNPGHGTHVAGIAAAATDNGIGVAGTAPDARILPVRVLGKHGCGLLEHVDQGIRWAADNGADVINLSLGEEVVIRNIFGSELGDAFEYAWQRGAIPVVAAGNDRIFPSGYRGVNAIVVAATDEQDQNPGFSNGVGDAKWGIAAPGSRILSTLPGNRYGNLSGTSMATPHVAGAAAVMRCLGLSKEQVVQRLLSTADDVGLPGYDLTFGYGRLNLSEAVAGLSGCGTEPAATSSEPLSPGASRPAGTSGSSPARPGLRPRAVGSAPPPVEPSSEDVGPAQFVVGPALRPPAQGAKSGEPGPSGKGSEVTGMLAIGVIIVALLGIRLGSVVSRKLRARASAPSRD